MQDPKKIAKNCPSGHHRATLSGYIFATEARIDNRKKKLVKQQYLLHMSPHNMVNFGPLTVEIDWRVWGTSSYFNRYRVLAALLHGTLLVGVSQTLQRWTEDATYIWQGDHHVGHWPTFLVSFFFSWPNLSGWRLDVCHTSTHGVVLVQI